MYVDGEIRIELDTYEVIEYLDTESILRSAGFEVSEWSVYVDSSGDGIVITLRK